MRATIRGRRCGLLLAALALGACDDSVTGPAARTRADMVADAGRPALFPGTMKYRDEGHHPMTGRAGGATITTRALLNRHGAAEVEVYAGALGGTGPGELSKVQLKRFTLAGEHQSTENRNGLATRAIVLQLLQVARNTPIQVQANVRGVAGARTGVVTVADVVKLRPDLTVLGVTAPPTAPTGVLVAVSAVVQEINRDVGARATCVLEVNGTPVDSAPRIWVDAGGMVTCEFVHRFTEPGASTLRVRVTGADPGDYDAANDGAETTIRLFDDVPFTSWSALAASDTFHTWTEHSYDLVAGAGTHERFRYLNDYSGVSQSASFSAYIRHPIAFPAAPLTDVSLSQATAGQTVHAATFPVLAAEDSSISSTSSSWCVARESTGEVVMRFSACTFETGATPPEGGYPYTWVRYDWNAGDVTYQSLQSHILQCMPGSSSGCWRSYPMYSSWGWNTTDHTITGRMVSFGSAYSITVSLMSGDERYAVTAVIPMSYRHSSSGTPVTCTTWGWTTWPYAILGFGHLTTCDGVGSENRTLHGAADG